MKLGISYMVFDGIELLEFATKSIRKEVDFISATYQPTSYFGNLADPETLEILQRLKSDGLIDEIIYFESDLTIPHKQNELKLRNVGLEASRKTECTHHISADVDEFYKVEELKYAKSIMDSGDYDFSAAHLLTYYKDPTFLVSPIQNLLVSFIHPVDNEYRSDIDYPTFPLHMEITRRFKNHKKYIIFDKNDFVIHHMSYVRKDIRKKFANSDNARFYKLNKFFDKFDKYQVGDRVCLLPDYLNRKTVQVENIFNIKF